MAEILHIQRKKNYPINQSIKQSINQNSNYKFLRYVFFSIVSVFITQKNIPEYCCLVSRIKKNQTRTLNRF